MFIYLPVGLVVASQAVSALVCWFHQPIINCEIFACEGHKDNVFQAYFLNTLPRVHRRDEKHKYPSQHERKKPRSLRCHVFVDIQSRLHLVLFSVLVLCDPSVFLSFSWYILNCSVWFPVSGKATSSKFRFSIFFETESLGSLKESKQE